MQLGRLRFTRNYNALTTVCIEIVYDPCDPICVCNIPRSGDSNTEFIGDSLRQWQYVAGGHCNAMISIGSGNRGSRLGGVKTIHRGAIRFNHAPAACEIARITQRVRMRIEKIGIECDDDLRLGKIAHHFRSADRVAV